ncbi:hypothetical protein EV189_3147 [Motilibacter rhizosphaerae]|uniref:Uncharacterized protein n=1 Tax=Motilibacter rhizosphaerae TaxID=598652 RepID=A0A4Q7NG18_9ACTN|nr:hypothetical protein [Motilibacter rhizosphaerae]RZS82752.1 hypothetical protein EV189_3147 [Motilibacter rhizosphaerae]
MSTIEPFVPHPDRDEEVAAADPGAGAPETAPGFGVEGEQRDTPFRTPDPEIGVDESYDAVQHARESLGEDADG